LRGSPDLALRGTCLLIGIDSELFPKGFAAAFILPEGGDPIT